MAAGISTPNGIHDASSDMGLARVHEARQPRKKRRWAEQEEQVLLMAMEVHGRAWTAIMSDHKFAAALSGRRPADLKDKFVNLQKQAKRRKLK